MCRSNRATRPASIGIREAIKTAEEHGLLKGEAKGKAEGRIEGRAEAMAEAEQNIQKTIITLYNNNIPLAIIASSVQKTEAEVQVIIIENSIKNNL